MAFGVTNFSLKFSEKHDKIRLKKQGISINSISVTYEDLYLRNIPVTENPCFKLNMYRQGGKGLLLLLILVGQFMILAE